MKRERRVTLYCWKKLPCGVIDSFRVVVSEKDEGAAKAKYKSMGYEAKQKESEVNNASNN